VSTLTTDASSETASRGDKSTTAGTYPTVAPVRTRRSGIWLAGAIVLLLLGAIGGVFVYTSASNTQQVLVTKQAIQRGETINREDLTSIAIGAGQSTQAIPVSQASSVLGKIATDNISAGGLVTPTDISTGLAVPTGQALVGLDLKPNQLPGQSLTPGDKISIVPVATQAANGSPAPVNPSEVISATVSDVSQASDSGGSSGNVIVDVYVPAASAAQLTSQASAGAVAIYLTPGQLPWPSSP